MWEDEKNKNGGKIALKLRKDYSNLVWEELIFAFIGGYFAKEIKDEINGLVINCKKDLCEDAEDKFMMWNFVKQNLSTVLYGLIFDNEEEF